MHAERWHATVGSSGSQAAWTSGQTQRRETHWQDQPRKTHGNVHREGTRSGCYRANCLKPKIIVRTCWSNVDINLTSTPRRVRSLNQDIYIKQNAPCTRNWCKILRISRFGLAIVFIVFQCRFPHCVSKWNFVNIWEVAMYISLLIIIAIVNFSPIRSSNFLLVLPCTLFCTFELKVIS